MPGYLTITVGGVNVSAHVVRGSVSTNLASGGRNSASFKLITKGGSIPLPQMFDEVTISHVSGPTLLFGGLVDSIEDTKFGGTSGYRERLIRCIGYGAQLERSVARAVYYAEDGYGTVEDIFADLFSSSGAAGGYAAGGAIPVALSYDTGQTVTPNTTPSPLVLNWLTVLEAARQVCDAAGCDFYIDNTKNVRLISEGAGYGNAPFAIEQNDGNWRTLTANYTNTKFWNHVIAVGSMNVQPVQEKSTVSDGSDGYFFDGPWIGASMGSGSALPPGVVYLNGVPVSGVGFVPGNGISFSESPEVDDAITVQMAPVLDPSAEAWDEDSIAALGRITYLKRVPNAATMEALQAIADTTLAEGLDATPDLTITTHRPGIEPGHALVVNANDVDATVLVTQVSMSDGDNGYPLFTIGTQGRPKRKGTAAEMMTGLLNRANQVDRVTDAIRFKLAETIYGQTNPGAVPGTETGAVSVAYKSGALRRALLYFQTGSGSVTIDVKRNGTSIFSGGGLTWSPGGVAQSMAFASNPYYVNIGDVFTLEVQGAGDASVKDGVLVLEQVG